MIQLNKHLQYTMSKTTQKMGKGHEKEMQFSLSNFNCHTSVWFSGYCFEVQKISWKEFLGKETQMTWWQEVSAFAHITSHT